MSYDWSFYNKSETMATIWLFFLIGELLSVWINTWNGYDNIKIKGSNKMGLAKNVLTRITGIYIFCLACAEISHLQVFA